MIGHLALINEKPKSHDDLEKLLSYDSYYNRSFGKEGVLLDSKGQLEERLAFLTGGITALLGEACQRMDSPFHADFLHMEKEWQAIAGRVRLDVPKDQFSSQLSDLNDRMKQVWYKALGIEEDNLYKREFASLRAQSLEYLTEIDPRGIMGWEKVDRTIRTIVELIHRNPHTYHWGESCSGHVHDFDGRYLLSNGYIQIGMDKSPDAAILVGELEALSKELPNLYFKIEDKHFEGVALRVGAFDHEGSNERGGIERGKCSREELLAIEEKMIGVWQKVEEVLVRHAAVHERVWDREKTAIWKNPYD